MRNIAQAELRAAAEALQAALDRAALAARQYPAQRAFDEWIRAVRENVAAWTDGSAPANTRRNVQLTAFAASLRTTDEPKASTPCGEALRLAADAAKQLGYCADELFEMGMGVTADVLRELKGLPNALLLLAAAADATVADAKVAEAPMTDAADRLPENSRTAETAAAENLPEAQFEALTCAAAVRFCEALNAHSRTLGFASVAAVCDAGGNLLALHRDDDALIASIDIAMNKAYTAVSLKMTTEALAELAAPGGSLYGIQQTNGGRIVIFGGGAPISVGGKIAGGFGVSGGTAAQDTEMAHFGLRLAEKWFGGTV